MSLVVDRFIKKLAISESEGEKSKSSVSLTELNDSVSS